MANLPTEDETIDAILTAIGDYNVRPGQSVPMLGMQMNVLAMGFQTDDINAALPIMMKEDLITVSDRNTVSLTDAGFARVP